MKKVIALSAALLMVTASFATEGKGSLKVKAEKSTLIWTGKKITGSSHSGTIAVQSGSIDLQDGMIAKADIIIDMMNMTCTDDMEQQYKDKLIGHLQSEDFFNTDAHKTATFKLTEFKRGKRNIYNVTGELTIKGITKEISFPATVNVTDGNVTVDAEVSIDRTKWDVHYGSGSIFDGLGDNAILDNVDINIHLEASK